MKKIATALFAAAIAIGAVSPALAAPVCLDITRIHDTHAPDARHILFTMTNGDVWRATLKNSCPDLKFNGFSYEPFASREICENAQTIHTLQNHQVCLIGGMEKVHSRV